MCRQLNETVQRDFYPHEIVCPVVMSMGNGGVGTFEGTTAIGRSIEEGQDKEGDCTTCLTWGAAKISTDIRGRRHMGKECGGFPRGP